MHALPCKLMPPLWPSRPVTHTALGCLTPVSLSDRGQLLPGHRCVPSARTAAHTHPKELGNLLAKEASR